ncbi:MAG TPA: D-alanyl-D-alanine endopeptidase, partial [Pseudomonas sp.]|nr:D-alanyl-D-alanine endopeptidase [Pseudomonas sp.]
MTPFLKAGLLAISLITASHYAVAAPLNNNLKHQELAAGSALLVDLKTNQVLYSSNPDFVAPIASVTKL